MESKDLIYNSLKMLYIRRLKKFKKHTQANLITDLTFCFNISIEEATKVYNDWIEQNCVEINGLSNLATIGRINLKINQKSK